jgi:membrane protein required for colicin V production
MGTLDWILLAVLLLSLLLGALRGLVYEAVSLLAWGVAFWLAQGYALDAARKLPLDNASEPLRYAAGFTVVFVATIFAGGLLAWLTKKLVQALGLRPADRTLGGAFGLLRGAVLLLALAIVVNLTTLKSSRWWQASQGATLLTSARRELKPVVPENFGRYLPS